MGLRKERSIFAPCLLNLVTSLASGWWGCTFVPWTSSSAADDVQTGSRLKRREQEGQFIRREQGASLAHEETTNSGSAHGGPWKRARLPGVHEMKATSFFV